MTRRLVTANSSGGLDVERKQKLVQFPSVIFHRPLPQPTPSCLWPFMRRDQLCAFFFFLPPASDRVILYYFLCFVLFCFFFWALDRKAGDDRPSGGSAKSYSGVYLWTSVGGDTHTPRPPETYCEATGAPGPEGLHTGRLLLGRRQKNKSRAASGGEAK